MKIGHLHLTSNLVLAPMSGITDSPFRRIAKEQGCSLVFTEMISSEGLLHKRDSLLNFREEEHPIAVQLFGSEPDIIAEAAQIAEEMEADVVDINMGCPAGQVVDVGAGVMLMRSPEKVKRIINEVRKRVKLPLTIKIRSGWDKEHLNAVEISKIAEDYGCDAISVHPRTKTQGFHGQAEWSLIKEVKERIHIPVIGNGDVKTPLLAKKMLKETGCDGVMIGRGALGNPWIFRAKLSSLSEEDLIFSPSLEEREKTIKYHFSLLQEVYGEQKALKKIRKHLVCYTKGLFSSTSFRSTLSKLIVKEDLLSSIESYFEFLKRKMEKFPLNPISFEKS